MADADITNEVKSILASLNKDKGAFLDAVEREIRTYIVSRGAQCIALVERNKDGSIHRHWNDLLSKSYCKVLFRFVSGKQNEGRDIDSALSEPISDIVARHFGELYKNKEADITKSCLEALMKNDLILESFAGRLVDMSTKKLSGTLRKKVVHEIVLQIHDSINHGTLHQVGLHVGQVASNVAGTQVGVILGHMLIKLLSAHIGAVIVHLMASPAFHKLIIAVVHKFVLAAVLAAVSHFLAAHVGVAVGGSTLLMFVIPLLLAYLAYAIATFPEKLGKDVSKNIRQELSKNFESLNRPILQSIFDEVLNGEKIVQQIAKDHDFQKLLTEIIVDQQ